MTKSEIEPLESATTNEPSSCKEIKGEDLEKVGMPKARMTNTQNVEFQFLRIPYIQEINSSSVD
ncbi:MAG: hypothetical protein EBZ44_04680 [Verrucomicrobia bacterium]|nr:hypothetical protein [Verrucomicrobiota bacterium]